MMIEAAGLAANETPVGLHPGVDLSALRGIDQTVPLDREWQAVASGTVCSADVTVELDDPGAGVAVLLDDATSRILELEARGYHPRQLSVPRAAYDRIASLRAREVERGVPLIVLGLPLIASDR